MDAYKILPPAIAPPVRQSHGGIYVSLEALARGKGQEWLPIKCADKEAARSLGLAVQQRYRKSGDGVRCETRMDPEKPIIYLRLANREGRAA